MLHYPDLSDGTITLRPWTEADIPEIHALIQDPEIPRYLAIPPDQPIERTARWVRSLDTEMSAGRSVHLAVTDAHTGRPLGSVGVELSCADQAIGEIGYWTAAASRRRGVATAAVQLVSEWAFEVLGLSRLEITTHEDNQASQSVALSNGFTREGVLREYRLHHGVRVDLVMYSKLRSETEMAKPG